MYRSIKLPLFLDNAIPKIHSLFLGEVSWYRIREVAPCAAVDSVNFLCLAAAILHYLDGFVAHGGRGAPVELCVDAGDGGWDE